MYCVKCGVQLQDVDQFCARCGTSVHAPPARPTPRSPLSRPMDQKKIAGVCAGFARYLEVDVTLVRVIWLCVALCAGAGLLAYLVAWLVMPKDYPAAT
jgi:phage shock protein C